MRLDRIELNLRRRSSWEAIDLGLVMVRCWCGPVYRAWLATFIVPALLLLAALWAWPTLGMLVVWWLKPVADRILLKVFSEATFGEPPTVREVWRSIPGLLRHSGLVSALTFRRFNPGRSFLLPVSQLEGQQGKNLRSRCRILNRKTAGYAFWLLFVCAHLVVIFETGLLQLVELMTPGDRLSDFSLYQAFFGERDLAELYLLNAAWLIAESIVEPFYVAAGFSLYLNRRSELEGWDIEVAFRHMAETRQGPAATPVRGSRRGGAGVVALWLLFAGSVGVTGFPEARAEEAPPVVSGSVVAVPAEVPVAPVVERKKPSGEVHRVAQEIVADPVFGRDIEEMSWRPRVKAGEKEDHEAPSWFRHLQTLVEWIAKGVRGLSYLLMAVVLATLLVLIYRYRERFPGLPRRAAKAPETLFGLDLRPASLPADIPSAALKDAEAGRFAAALSLLYRGALVALIERHQVRFREGDTENACLQRAAGCVKSETLHYFSDLLDAWKKSAYGALPPSLPEMRGLCQAWGSHFSGRGESA